eukprot:426552-Alexandrium_andersonii.AAC.1
MGGWFGLEKICSRLNTKEWKWPRPFNCGHMKPIHIIVALFFNELNEKGPCQDAVPLCWRP